MAQSAAVRRVDLVGHFAQSACVPTKLGHLVGSGASGCKGEQPRTQPRHPRAPRWVVAARPGSGDRLLHLAHLHHQQEGQKDGRLRHGQEALSLLLSLCFDNTFEQL